MLFRLERNALVVLNESKDVAVFSARPAPVILKLRVDVKRGAMIVMERTQALELLAGGAQSDIRANDVDNVVRFLDPLGQASPIVRQKTPVGRKIKRKRPPPRPGSEPTSIRRRVRESNQRRGTEKTNRKSSVGKNRLSREHQGTPTLRRRLIQSSLLPT